MTYYRLNLMRATAWIPSLCAGCAGCAVINQSSTPMIVVKYINVLLMAYSSLIDYHAQLQVQEPNDEGGHHIIVPISVKARNINLPIYH